MPADSVAQALIAASDATHVRRLSLTGWAVLFAFRKLQASTVREQLASVGSDKRVLADAARLSISVGAFGDGGTVVRANLFKSAKGAFEKAVARAVVN